MTRLFGGGRRRPCSNYTLTPAKRRDRLSAAGQDTVGSASNRHRFSTFSNSEADLVSLSTVNFEDSLTLSGIQEIRVRRCDGHSDLRHGWKRQLGGGTDRVAVGARSGRYGLIGSFGNDTSSAKVGANSLFDAGDGNESVLAFGQGASTLDEGARRDTLRTGRERTASLAADGNGQHRERTDDDTLLGGEGNDSLSGSSGEDPP